MGALFFERESIMSTTLRLASIAALALAIPMLTPAEAEACGGTFCDNGPQTMPVDQTGENILFKIGEDYVEAHIQIQIDPNTSASKFAWVIPVTALPEFSVGSQLFFNNMLNASVPTYGIQNQADFCGDDGADGAQNGGDGLSTGGEGDPAGDSGDAGDGDEESGPDIVFKGSVGAFEIAVLDGGTVEGVMEWLGANGYQQDPKSQPILQYYLENEEHDFMFVALKLGVQSGVEDVHPIVIRYAGNEPCVPIRLTAIAAADDMEIRTFFLGDERVVPTNYRHVLINSLRLDWFNLAANYKEVISMAVDAQEADGNAFVTEYAGVSNTISMAGVIDDGWDAAPFAALIDSPIGAIELLEQQNLMLCDVEWDNACTTFHPLLQGILDQYIPVPTGVQPVDFYNCLSCFAPQIDLDVWTAEAFSLAIDQRIIQPGRHARDLVMENPYLTRMYTTISPSEMNMDPIFRANGSLPEVPNVRIANQTTHCDGSVSIDLPDGRSVYFPVNEPLVWPEFQDEMPWDEDIDQDGMAQDAPLIKLVDNTEKINELLEDYNNGRINGGDDSGLDNVDLPGGNCVCTVNDEVPVRDGLLGLGLLGVFGLLRRRR
jgi:MYXO-CTERM domain-containing protein